MDQDEAKRVVEMRYGLVIREDPFLPAKLPMLAKRTRNAKKPRQRRMPMHVPGPHRQRLLAG